MIERFSATRAGRKWKSLSPRSRRVMAGGAVIGLVIVVVGALVLGPLSGARNGRGSSASGTPSHARTSAKASKTAAPTPTPTEDLTPRTAQVLASVACKADSTLPVSAGGRLYVSCGGGAEVQAIDLATDKVVKTYQIDRHIPQPPCSGTCTNLNPPPGLIVVDKGLWLGWGDSAGSGDSGGSTLMAPEVRRLDLDTGKVTDDFQESTLIDDVSGQIWLLHAGRLETLDPATAKHVGWMSNDVASSLTLNETAVACGSVWTWDNLVPESIQRIDPQTGATLWQGNIGAIGGVFEAAGVCWAIAVLGGAQQLARLDASCEDFRSANLPSIPFSLGNTFWMWAGTDGKSIQQINLLSGAHGRVWTLADQSLWMIDADGQVWAQSGGSLVRYDLPLNHVPGGGTPSAMSCNSATPSDTAAPETDPAERGPAAS